MSVANTVESKAIGTRRPLQTYWGSLGHTLEFDKRSSNCILYDISDSDAFEDDSLGFLTEDWLTLGIYFMIQRPGSSVDEPALADIELFTCGAVDRTANTVHLIEFIGSNFSRRFHIAKKTPLSVLKEKVCSC